MNNLLILKSIKQLKRWVVAVVGFTILLIGVAMILLPGPAFIVIPLGIGILATEFVWARRLLKKFRLKNQKEGGSYVGEAK